MSYLNIAALAAAAVTIVAGTLAVRAEPWSVEREEFSIYATICLVAAAIFAVIGWLV